LVLENGRSITRAGKFAKIVRKDTESKGGSLSRNAGATGTGVPSRLKPLK
jgi:hypothetical protein